MKEAPKREKRGDVQKRYWYIYIYIYLCVHNTCIYIYIFLGGDNISYMINNNWHVYIYIYTYVNIYIYKYMFPIPGRWETSYISRAASSPFHHLRQGGVGGHLRTWRKLLYLPRDSRHFISQSCSQISKNISKLHSLGQFTHSYTVIHIRVLVRIPMPIHIQYTNMHLHRHTNTSTHKHRHIHMHIYIHRHIEGVKIQLLTKALWYAIELLHFGIPITPPVCEWMKTACVGFLACSLHLTTCPWWKYWCRLFENSPTFIFFATSTWLKSRGLVV